jgi:hypothetical protein
MSPYSRAYEKFYLAVERLCVGEGDARSRIKSAYYYLSILYPEQIPPEHQAEVKSILERIENNNYSSKNLNPNDDLIAHNTYCMKNKTASQIANRIFVVGLKILTNHH